MSNLIRTVDEILQKRNIAQITTSINKIEAGIKENLDAIENGKISEAIRQCSIEMNILLSKRLANLYKAKEIISPTK